MKKLISLLLTTALAICACFSFASCSNSKYTVGILQLAPHPALDAATEGFKAALIEEFGEENLEFLLQNAQGDPST